MTEAVQTLGSLCEAFKRAYGLADKKGFKEVQHDSVHAMTGLGIGTPDELRVTACEVGLYLGRTRYLVPSVLIAPMRVKHLHHVLGIHHLYPAGYRLNAGAMDYLNPTYLSAQRSAEILPRAETVAFYKLGLEMRGAIKKLTGKNYTALTAEQIAKLDFTGLDFVAKAQGIKQKYQTAHEKQAERLSLQSIHAAAREISEDRAALIPAPGTPWHGPQFRPIGLQA